MKRALRTAVVHALYGLGLLQLWARVALRRRAVVLMYHRVLPDADRSQTWSHPAIVVSRTSFERQMRMLARRFRVLSPEEFQRCLDAGRFPPYSCLITFDDGWIDAYTEAWPVLRRYGLPALVFLPSAFIGTGEVFWQERLGALVRAVCQRATDDTVFAARARHVLTDFNLHEALDLRGDGARLAIMDLVRSKKRDAAWEPGAVVRALSALVPDTAENIDRFIDWEHALEMARDGVRFGAHSHSHRLLTMLPQSEVEEEVQVSWASLGRHLGMNPAAFCYPSGDWNAAVAKIVGQTFALAFSTRRGPVDPQRDNRLALPRVNVHEDMTGSEPLMLARILGII